VPRKARLGDDQPNPTAWRIKNASTCTMDDAELLEGVKRHWKNEKRTGGSDLCVSSRMRELLDALSERKE